MCNSGTCPDCVADAHLDEIDELKKQLEAAHEKIEQLRKFRIPCEQEQHAFCDELEKYPGVLARRYDTIHRERLAVAAMGIHGWLSTLDNSYQPAAARMTLAQFATIWAESRGPGLRRFETPANHADAAAQWRALMVQDQNAAIDEIRDTRNGLAAVDSQVAEVVATLLERLTGE